MSLCQSFSLSVPILLSINSPAVFKELGQEVNVDVHEDVEDALFLHGGDGGVEVLDVLCTLRDGCDAQGEQ